MRKPTREPKKTPPRSNDGPQFETVDTGPAQQLNHATQDKNDQSAQNDSTPITSNVSTLQAGNDHQAEISDKETAKARARRIFLRELTAGESHEVAMQRAGVRWCQVQGWKVNREFMDRYQRAILNQTEARRVVILEAVHGRALKTRETKRRYDAAGKLIEYTTQPARNESLLLAHAAALDPAYRRDGGNTVNIDARSVNFNGIPVAHTLSNLLTGSTDRAGLTPKKRDAQVIDIVSVEQATSHNTSYVHKDSLNANDLRTQPEDVATDAGKAGRVDVGETDGHGMA